MSPPDEDPKPLVLKDSVGRFLTASLFREQYNTNADRKEYPPIFTLKDQSYDDPKYGHLISFKQVYLQLSDPTGYLAALELLGSWKHWQKLCTAPWFQKHLAEWQDELEVKLKSEGIRRIYDASQADPLKGYQASKYLAEKGWEPKRGRPTKAEVDKEKKIQAKLTEALDDDLERIQPKPN